METFGHRLLFRIIEQQRNPCIYIQRQAAAVTVSKYLRVVYTPVLLLSPHPFTSCCVMAKSNTSFVNSMEWIPNQHVTPAIRPNLTHPTGWLTLRFVLSSSCCWFKLLVLQSGLTLMMSGGADASVIFFFHPCIFFFCSQLIRRAFIRDDSGYSVLWLLPLHRSDAALVTQAFY